MTGGAIARPGSETQETEAVTAKATAEMESSSDVTPKKESSAKKIAIGGGIALATIGIYTAVKKKGGK